MRRIDLSSHLPNSIPFITYNTQKPPINISIFKTPSPPLSYPRRVRKLMETLALRRMKSQKVDGKPLVDLPARNVVLQYVDFSDDEKDVYKTMEKDGRLAVSKYDLCFSLYNIIFLGGCLTLTALGGRASEAPPRQILPRTLNRPLHDFFLCSHTDILTPSFQKSDIPLRSHMTFCHQRSTRKVRFLSFCVQNNWQSEFFILACRAVIFPLFPLYIIYSNLILIQMNWVSNSGNHKTIKYIKFNKIKYIRNV